MSDPVVDDELRKGEEADKERIRKLEAQVFQLKNIIAKLTGQSEEKNNKKRQRVFDVNLYTKRHVLLQICYFGWNYHGFAVQETSGKTIESELFKALLRTRLIESRETSNYHRCGRTDRGVSAFSQVVSIDLRSRLQEGLGVRTYEGCLARDSSSCSSSSSEGEEINYCRLLNANLPADIQVVAWAPTSNPDYSARFNCVERTYKYFFPAGDLNLEAINEAGSLLLGEHDFRNFCKMDVANGVVNYRRNLTLVRARVLDEDDEDSSGFRPHRMCGLTIRGKAFLWHQVRCIVSVLFRIGLGKEHPSVVSELLDVQTNPRRPQYTMAVEFPLNLFQVRFDDDFEWVRDDEALQLTVKSFQSMWTEHAIKGAMLKECLAQLEAELKQGQDPPLFQAQTLVATNFKAKDYIPLMQMQCCLALEEKLNSSASKRRKV